MAPHNIHFCSLLVILDKNVLKNLRGQKMPTVLHKDTDYWRVSKSQLWQTFQNQPSRSPKEDAQKKAHWQMDRAQLPTIAVADTEAMTGTLSDTQL